MPDKKIGSWIMMKVCKKEEDALQVDFALLRGCKREVQQHCSDQPADQLLHCLKDWAGQDANFAFSIFRAFAFFCCCQKEDSAEDEGLSIESRIEEILQTGIALL